MSAPVIVARPAQLHDAVRLANEALEQLVAAIGALDDDDSYDDLYQQLEAASDDLKSAIGYMTAVPEVWYLGQHIHPGVS
jgi:hypothetical protein